MIVLEEHEACSSAVRMARGIDDPSDPGAPTPGIDEGSMRIVLDWITSTDELAHRIQDVPGATAAQRAFLTRLSAVILSFVDPLATPGPLLAALRPAAPIVVPDVVRTAMRRLLDTDAVASLAVVYAQTVSATNRRVLGTFFTPRAEAESMVDEYSRRHGAPACVVDVGAGVGVFSEAASREWPDAEIHAVDINPVTLGLQEMARTAGESRVELWLADYAAWLAEFRPTGSTLYLGNPPYTRWQLIPPERRAPLVEASGSLVGARANLSTLFLAMTLVKLRDEDGLCLIVPAAWMSAHYARQLREHVRTQHRRPVTLRLADSWRFDNAIVDAVVVQIGPKESADQPFVVTDWPGVTTTTEVRERKDGGAPFARLGDGGVTDHLETEDDVRLADVAVITRGTATGANRFFLLDRSRVDASGIPDRWLVPVIRRLRLGATPEAPNAEFASMLVLDGYERGDDPQVDAAITAAEALGVHDGHLCAKRQRSWFDLSQEVLQPDVAVSALSKARFHVHENVERCSITNNLFGLTWHGHVNAVTRAAVMSWLRSQAGQAALVRSASIEAEGLRRLSPRTLGAIRVPITSPCGPAATNTAMVGGTR